MLQVYLINVPDISVGTATDAVGSGRKKLYEGKEYAGPFNVINQPHEKAANLDIPEYLGISRTQNISGIKRKPYGDEDHLPMPQRPLRNIPKKRRSAARN